MKIHASKLHPRYLSNYYRDLLVWGVHEGLTSPQGLIAQGRGETFDYLIGEKTWFFAKAAVIAALAVLIDAKHPVISVNGNTAVLASADLVKLSQMLKIPLEINLFHKSKQRERKIADYLRKNKATNILLPDEAGIPNLSSNRRFISKHGQMVADVVFIPLEDGDRTEHLISMGKKVITVDLNPLSRTAQKATITIVDNIVRALPLMIKLYTRLKNKKKEKLEKIIREYNNQAILKEAISHINKHLK